MEIDLDAWAFRAESPAGAVKITEIGWWSSDVTEEANFEVGIYEHNIGDDNPEALVEKADTNAKGTGTGWKRVTGLDITITPETVYWLAVQVDNTATPTKIDLSPDAGEKADNNGAKTTLEDPWGVSDATYGQLVAVYAVYGEEASAEAGKAGSIKEESLRGDYENGIQ